MKRLRWAVAALAVMLPLNLSAAQIYFDDFNGAAGVDLNGTTPDVGATAWAGNGAFDANGLITPVANGSSALLPFTPAAGNRYTLSASFRGVTGNTNWFGLGFVESVPANPAATGNDNRFISGGTVGKAWTLFRGATSPTAPLQTLRGDAASGTFAAGTLPWQGSIAAGGDIDLRIVLDTTGGAGTFKALFLAKRPTDASYTDIGGGQLALNAEDIGAVGLVFSNTGINGSVVSFRLDVVPEPATSAVALTALLGLATSIRKRRAVA